MKDFWAWEDFKTMKRIRLGDALVDKGLITQEQLQEALTKGKLSGKRVGSIFG